MPFELPEGRVCVMGVLNVTPDSFSDGGEYLEPERAVEHGLEMVGHGADLVDVGGESTRPGAAPVPAGLELERVLPVVEGLARAGVAVSIDTMKPEVAEACLKAGARVVNDVSALRADGMLEACTRWGCSVCLMHMQGEPKTMQLAPKYGDVVAEVKQELGLAANRALAAGLAKQDVWLDPGIGFGKTVEHNLRLLGKLDDICALGHPVLVGVSRKSFVGKLLGSEDAPLPVGERLEGSLAAQVVAQARGARIVRTHDVRQTVRATRMTDAILSLG